MAQNSHVGSNLMDPCAYYSLCWFQNLVQPSQTSQVMLVSTLVGYRELNCSVGQGWNV